MNYINDEFAIMKVVGIGSNGTYLKDYLIDFTKHGVNVEDLSLDELKRLNTFLIKFIAEEEKGDLK